MADRFDFAPVTRSGDLCGFIRTEELVGLSGPLADRQHPLAASCLVSGDTSLGTLMSTLARAPFLFVVAGGAVSGIVTPSDLNKQAGRTYFYLLVAAVEMNLAERVRGHFSDQENVLALLSDERVSDIRERLAGEQRDDVASDIVAALNLSELLKIVKKTDAFRLAFGGLPSQPLGRRGDHPGRGSAEQRDALSADVGHGRLLVAD